MFQIKRIYEPAKNSDGCRVLIDRLWPRGVSREDAALDMWLKEIAPSQELREWFGHSPERFEEFSARYESELAANPAVAMLQELGRKHKTVTLLYAAHEERVNNATVLLKYLRSA